MTILYAKGVSMKGIWHAYDKKGGFVNGVGIPDVVL